MTNAELALLASTDQNSEALMRAMLNHRHFFDFHGGAGDNITGKSVQTFLAAVIAVAMGWENTQESFDKSMAMAALTKPDDLAQKCRDFIREQEQSEGNLTLGEI